MTLVADSNIDIKAWQFCHPRWHETVRRVCRSEPGALVIPHNRAALGEIVKTAQQEKKTIIPCGNGSKLAWGGVTSGADWLVSTKKLNGILEHAVNDLTITVEAGLTLAALQKHLAAYNQFLPLDPSFPADATLGGIVATADAGSWRQRYGGVRDLLLGITVVRTDGEFAKAGGKVVKNVAGYDLMKLFTGSYGSLAIATELTFRLYPLQELSQTILVTGSNANIAKACQRLMDSVLTPTGADLLSQALMQQLDLGNSFGLLVRFEAIQESITAQINELEAIAAALSLQTQSQPETLWRKISATIHQSPVYCKVGVLPTHATELLTLCETLTDGAGSGMIHIKSGLGLLHFPHAKFLRQFQEVRQFCQQNQGFLTVLDAPYSLKTQFEPCGYNGSALPLMKKIKQQFDPNNLLSPGRFVGKI
ncbi:MAG: FAD-binding oxidoreductase [Limnothrix sp.]